MKNKEDKIVLDIMYLDADQEFVVCDDFISIQSEGILITYNEGEKKIFSLCMIDYWRLG